MHPVRAFGLKRPYRVGIAPRFLLAAWSIAAGIWSGTALLSAALSLLAMVWLGEADHLGLTISMLMPGTACAWLSVTTWRWRQCGVWVGPDHVAVRNLGHRWAVYPRASVRGMYVESRRLFIGTTRTPVLELDDGPVAISMLSRASSLTWGGAGPQEICDAVTAALSPAATRG